MSGLDQVEYLFSSVSSLKSAHAYANHSVFYADAAGTRLAHLSTRSAIRIALLRAEPHCFTFRYDLNLAHGLGEEKFNLRSLGS